MNAKIAPSILTFGKNLRGFLMVERKGVFVSQFCPFINDGSKCGDWCPLFEESLRVSDPFLPTVKAGLIVRLNCTEGLVYDLVADERQNPEPCTE